MAPNALDVSHQLKPFRCMQFTQQSFSLEPALNDPPLLDQAIIESPLICVLPCLARVSAFPSRHLPTTSHPLPQLSLDLGLLARPFFLLQLQRLCLRHLPKRRLRPPPRLLASSTPVRA